MSEDRSAPVPAPTALSRRDSLRLLGSAGLLAAAAPLVGAQSAAPASPAAPLNGNGFYRQKVGDLSAIIVSDGTAPLAAVLPTWGANPDRQAEFAATLAEYHVPATNTVNHFNPVVIETGANRVLIDTGRGGEAGQLLANLRRAGIDPASIDTVFITHAHGDHIGGLTTGGQPNFPGARHVIGGAEFQFWTTQAEPNAAVKANLIALRDRFTFLQPGAEIVPGLTAVASPGHTLNHLSVLAQRGNEGLMVFGDAAGHFLLSLRHRGAYIGFDADGPLAARTRQRLFERVVSEGLWVTGYHFPFHATGHVRRAVGGAYEYEPAVWNWS
ncbi:MBL fold metallo-hydrolase [Deinococcus hopiensis]|uniref:Metal-dependent hydrolases of the beta-lactamase superfamily II n=1 Tax=Deinococcus hopiensis KR-140 TaxID=695939 RepID=A0A1W1VN25_9DEIO|nr:MBL fold metallo-hydrolase [Deinococcus hopiensis]SMB94757.1 Metal-dependent hydrolases of the beta-lactamase superfamily II [Deinococcus hopiensis KR-140]